MALTVGRRESLVFVLAIVVFIGGWTYPKLEKYRRLSKVEMALLADDFSTADQELANYLSRNSADPDAWILYAVIARRTEQSVDFENRLSKARERGASVNLIDFQRQLLETQRGKIDKPGELALLKTADQFASDFLAAQTYEAIARGYLSTYRLNEAWGCIEHWLQWRPQSLSAHFIRAEIILRTQGPVGVIEPYREILKLDPSSQAAQEKLAVNLLAINEVDEAAALLRNLAAAVESDMTSSFQWTLVPIRSNLPQIWIELAEAERRLGDIEETEAAVQLAMSLGLDDKQRARVSTIRGQIQLIEQQPEEAVANFLVAIEMTPEDVAAHHALGTAFGFLGQTDLATKHRDAAQSIRASIGEVTRLSQQVISAPNDPELRMRIGQEFLKQGLVAEGIGWIKTALDCDANFAPARRLLSSLPADQPTPLRPNAIGQERL